MYSTRSIGNNTNKLTLIFHCVCVTVCDRFSRPNQNNNKKLCRIRRAHNNILLRYSLHHHHHLSSPATLLLFLFVYFMCFSGSAFFVFVAAFCVDSLMPFFAAAAVAALPVFMIAWLCPVYCVIYFGHQPTIADRKNRGWYDWEAMKQMPLMFLDMEHVRIGCSITSPIKT